MSQSGAQTVTASRTEMDSASGGGPSRAPFRTSLSPHGTGPRYGNMMYDPRVKRGNTHAHHRVTGVLRASTAHMSGNSRNHSRTTTGFSKHGSAGASRRFGGPGSGSQYRHRRGHRHSDDYDSHQSLLETPRAVDGRRHMSLQTEEYLEEIRVDPHALDKSLGIQTDAMLDRPSTPLFIPQLSGPSIATQIEKGDLFDFDVEVQPILEVILGKTLTSAVEEVIEETEQQRWTEHRDALEAKRLAIIAECHALEQKERVREAERRKRLEQEIAREKAEQKLKVRVEAQRAAKEFVANLEEHVLQILEDKGMFADPCDVAIEKEIMPNLEKATDKLIEQSYLFDDLITDTINTSVMNIINDSQKGLSENIQMMISDSQSQELQNHNNQRQDILSVKLKFARMLRSRFINHDLFLEDDLNEFTRISYLLNMNEDTKNKSDDQKDGDDGNEDDDEDGGDEDDEQGDQNDGDLSNLNPQQYRAKQMKDLLSESLKNLESVQTVWQSVETVLSLREQSNMNCLDFPRVRITDEDLKEDMTQFVTQSHRHQNLFKLTESIQKARNLNDEECWNTVINILNPPPEKPDENQPQQPEDGDPAAAVDGDGAAKDEENGGADAEEDQAQAEDAEADDDGDGAEEAEEEEEKEPEPDPMDVLKTEEIKSLHNGVLEILKLHVERKDDLNDEVTFAEQATGKIDEAIAEAIRKAEEAAAAEKARLEAEAAAAAAAEAAEQEEENEEDAEEEANEE